MQQAFENEARAKQLLDFNNLIDGKLGASDVDAIVEYHNELWIIFEVKTTGKGIPFGQNLMLNRLATDLEKTGKPVLLIVAEHSVLNPEENIILKDCLVRCYHVKGNWNTFQHPTTVGSFVNSFIKGWENKKLKSENY